MCTMIYPKIDQRMAMKVGSRRKFDDVGPEHWTAFAQATGLTPGIVRDRLHRTADRLPKLATELCEQDDSFAQNPTVGELRRLLDMRCAKVATRRLT